MPDWRLLWDLFATFFNVGAFTFGGGWAMVPLIRRQVLDKHGWMNDSDFLDSIAVIQSAPGSITVNVAVIVGQRVAGWPGMLMAVLGAVLPSFLVILVVASFFLRLEASPAVERFLAGVRPVVLALMALAAWDVSKGALPDFFAKSVALGGLAIMLVFHVHPILVVLAAMAAGLVRHLHAARRARS